MTVEVTDRERYTFIRLTGEVQAEEKLKVYQRCLDRNENAETVSMLCDIRGLTTVLDHQAVAVLMHYADGLNIGRVNMALVTSDPGRTLYRDLVEMISDTHKVVVELGIHETVDDAEAWLVG